MMMMASEVHVTLQVNNGKAEVDNGEDHGQPRQWRTGVWRRSTDGGYIVLLQKEDQQRRVTLCEDSLIIMR